MVIRLPFQFVSNRPIPISKLIRTIGRYSVKNHFDVIEYLNDQTAPTNAEISTKLASMNSEYDTQEYARKRRGDYPSNGDQWDMIYKDNKNSTTTHAAAVEAVKTKWPKDNSGPV